MTNTSEPYIDDLLYKLSYGEMLYKDEYPQLSSNDLKQIKMIVFNEKHHKLIKPLLYKLYSYIGSENMLYCVVNIGDLKLVRRKLQSNDPKEKMLFRMIDGVYNKLDNSIEYKHKSDISHELLHLASTKPTKYNTGKKSGFSYVKGKQKHLEGMNEGYTELLNRRIFFNEKYNTNSYRKKVYFMRLIELLYDDFKDMENDYFKANYKSFENHLLNYLTLEEFNKLLLTFDKMDFLINEDEVREIFKLLKDIVRRTDDNEKIVLSKKYVDGYYKGRF